VPATAGTRATAPRTREPQAAGLGSITGPAQALTSTDHRLRGALPLARRRFLGRRHRFIDSREIKNNTIRSKDIRNGQVTGTDVRNNGVSGLDVNESSLAKVPSAASADSAAKAASATKAATAGVAGHATTSFNASNANAVGGVRERGIDVRLNAGTPAAEVFSFGGLRIVMNCGALGGGAGDLSFYLDTSQANAEAMVSGFSATAPAQAATSRPLPPISIRARRSDWERAPTAFRASSAATTLTTRPPPDRR